jgi:hypothetical protein
MAVRRWNRCNGLPPCDRDVIAPPQHLPTMTLVSTPKSKRSLTVTIGFGVLMLQAMTTPFAMVSAVRPPSGQPTWLTGLYLAADLAALAALGLVAFGRQVHQAGARFAPAVLVLPAWVTIALVSPLFHDTLGAAAMYSLYALMVGAVSAAPFLTKDALSLFAAKAASQAPAQSTLSTGPVA